MDGEAKTYIEKYLNGEKLFLTTFNDFMKKIFQHCSMMPLGPRHPCPPYPFYYRAAG